MGKKCVWERYIWNSTSVFDSLNQIASMCVCVCEYARMCVCARGRGGGGEVSYSVFLITYIYTSDWKKEILLYFLFGDHDIVYSDNKVIPWKQWDVHYSYVTDNCTDCCFLLCVAVHWIPSSSISNSACILHTHTPKRIINQKKWCLVPSSTVDVCLLADIFPTNFETSRLGSI